MNYNKPLPPIRISDLNERTFFNERDTENPEIRDMFKALGIIESIGTGIGEAKRSMRENVSPDLFYKTFDVNDNVTSVVIPVNDEYYEIKNGTKPKKKVWIENETKDFKQKILNSGYTKKIKLEEMEHDIKSYMYDKRSSERSSKKSSKKVYKKNTYFIKRKEGY